MAQRLMWSRVKGNGMRNHKTPGATFIAAPGEGAVPNGYSIEAPMGSRARFILLDVYVKRNYNVSTGYYTLILQGTMAPTRTYTISELAQEFAVTTRTIRQYEELGLLSPRREGPSRIFSHRDRVRLKLALRGKRLGFSLNEIREVFELYDLARDEKRQLREFLAKLERRRALLEQQREDIEVMLNEVNFFTGQCRRLLVEVDSSETEQAA